MGKDMGKGTDKPKGKPGVDTRKPEDTGHRPNINPHPGTEPGRFAPKSKRGK